MTELKAHYIKPYVEQDSNLHDCKFLWVENSFREARGESRIRVFRDIENLSWNIKIGLEFFTVNICPWCGEKFFEENNG
jgi:hypothetical protein